MKREMKENLVVFALVLFVVALGVTIAFLTTEPVGYISGTYVNDAGQEIAFYKDGTFKDILRFSSGIFSAPNYDRYWRSGNDITIGNTVAGPLPDPTFRIRGEQLVGYDSLWNRQTVRPDRPANLLGTYTSTDKETISLDRSGAIYDSQSLPTGSMVRMGIWKVENGNVSATYGRGETLIYAPVAGNLLLNGKELVKQTDETIVPATI